MIEAFLTDLDRGLAALADPATRTWWENYLKGEAAFRGVKMAGVRHVVGELWESHGLGAVPVDRVVDLALLCMRRGPTEDKLAGVLLLAERALGDLRMSHVDRLAEPLADGSLGDWNSCDWYCVKVLGPFVTAGDDVEVRARAVAAWRSADQLWQRRAAAVAFVNLAPLGDEVFTGFVDMLLEVCATNVADPTRWSQTSVGWLLRELSKTEPDRVRAFVEQHADQLSPEARKSATAKL